MSARDAESGSSTYKGGSGRAGGLGNGGIGGGMGGGGNWGGGMGGGAGRNGGIGNRTGLTTGNRMYGGMAMGRPGGKAMNPGAWGVRPAAPIGYGPLSGVTRPRQSVAVPASVPGVNPVPENVPPSPYVPNVFNQNYLNSITGFMQNMQNRYGWGNAVPGPGPSTPLDPNDATNWINSTGTPADLGAVQGGFGMTGYATNRYSGFGYPQQTINNTGPDGYPSPSPSAPYADNW